MGFKMNIRTEREKNGAPNLFVKKVYFWVFPLILSGKNGQSTESQYNITSNPNQIDWQFMKMSLNYSVNDWYLVSWINAYDHDHNHETSQKITNKRHFITSQIRIESYHDIKCVCVCINVLWKFWNVMWQPQ